MTRRTRAVIALIAVLAALGVGLYVYRAFDRMVTTAESVTPAELIPAGALIEAPMLTKREVPRPFTKEDIYLSTEELVGRVATVPLHPGMVIYRPFAVPQQKYRLVDDPQLEVVSFPVDPARAVGGQLQPGHRLDIWRLVSVRPSSDVELADLAMSQWATATLLVEAAPVVDVRAASGLAVSRSPQAIPGELEDNRRHTAGPGTAGALQVLTVAVPPTVAQRILTLVAEERAGAELWVSLAPLTRRGPSAGEETGDSFLGAGSQEIPTDQRPVTTREPAASDPIPEIGTAPTLSDTLDSSSRPLSGTRSLTGTQAVVTGTTGEGLPVRSGPGEGVVATLPEGTVVTIRKGVTLVEGVPWCLVETAETNGWVCLEYLEMDR